MQRDTVKACVTRLQRGPSAVNVCQGVAHTYRSTYITLWMIQQDPGCSSQGGQKRQFTVHDFCNDKHKGPVLVLTLVETF